MPLNVPEKQVDDAWVQIILLNSLEITILAKRYEITNEYIHEPYTYNHIHTSLSIIVRRVTDIILYLLNLTSTITTK